MQRNEGVPTRPSSASTALRIVPDLSRRHWAAKAQGLDSRVGRCKSAFGLRSGVRPPRLGLSGPPGSPHRAGSPRTAGPADDGQDRTSGRPAGASRLLRASRLSAWGEPALSRAGRLGEHDDSPGRGDLDVSPGCMQADERTAASNRPGQSSVGRDPNGGERESRCRRLTSLRVWHRSRAGRTQKLGIAVAASQGDAIVGAHLCPAAAAGVALDFPGIIAHAKDAIDARGVRPA